MEYPMKVDVFPEAILAVALLLSLLVGSGLT